MTSIVKNTRINASADLVWAAVCDFGAVHERLVPGPLTGRTIDDDVRTVTFANGATAREQLVGVDNDAWRLAYTVIESALGLTTHMSVVQVAPEDSGCRYIWTTDVLPHSAAERIDQLMTRPGRSRRSSSQRAGLHDRAPHAVLRGTCDSIVQS